MTKVVAATALALLFPAAAGAHVSVTPSLLESGREVELLIEIPGLRPGETPTTLGVSGPGVRTTRSERTGRLGEESRWLVRVGVSAPPGALPLLLVIRYADGRSIRIRQTVTVLPASAKSGDGRAVPLAIGAAVAVAAAGGALILLRRARVHE